MEKNEFKDDELIEDVKSDDGAPVKLIARCKKCGQILELGAKDCWKCSSKEIEEVAEEDNKDLRKIMLQSRMDKLESELKSVKKNNDILYTIVFIMAFIFVISLFTK